jgi:hypothetical protein
MQSTLKIIFINILENTFFKTKKKKKKRKYFVDYFQENMFGN